MILKFVERVMKSALTRGKRVSITSISYGPLPSQEIMIYRTYDRREHERLQELLPKLDWQAIAWALALPGLADVEALRRRREQALNIAGLISRWIEDCADVPKWTVETGPPAIADASFWTDEEMAQLSVKERALFAGLKSLADEEGNVKVSLSMVRDNIFPFDEFNTYDLAEGLAKLGRLGRIEIRSPLPNVEYEVHVRGMDLAGKGSGR